MAHHDDALALVRAITTERLHLMMILRLWPTLLLLPCVMSCGARRVELDYLRGLDYRSGRCAYLEGETQSDYRVRVEKWMIMSIDAQPHLQEREHLLIAKDQATRDPRLAIGDLVMVEGTHLRPVTAFTIIPFADPFTIPLLDVTAP